MKSNLGNYKIESGRISIFDFVMNARFTSPNFPADITERMHNELKDLHPSMVIGDGQFRFCMYKVCFSYMTARGNVKTKYQYILLNANDSNNESDDFERDVMLKNFIVFHYNKLNASKSYRKASDVKIIEAELISNIDINIG